MKKLIKTLLIVTLLFAFQHKQVVKAATYQTRINGATSTSLSLQANSRFTITVSMSDASDVYGVRSRISYNTSQLKLISAKNLWTNEDLSVSSHFALSSTSPKNGTFNLVSLTFEMLNLPAGQSSRISLSEVEVTYAKIRETSGGNSSVTVNSVAPKSSNNNLASITVDGKALGNFKAGTTSYNLGATDNTSITVAATLADAKARLTGGGKLNLAYGLNVIRLVATAENGAAKTYELRITRNDYRSTNNYLKDVKVSSGKLIFDKERTNYTVIVDHDVSEMTISVEKDDAKASLKDTSITKKLEIYSNKFDFTVTAENTSKRTYSINVVRRDEKGYAGSLNTNNFLKTFEIEDFELDFSKDVLEYNLRVDHQIKALDVTLEVDDEKASLVAPENFELELGNNRFEVLVIAEDETQKIYVLNVYREKNISPLDIESLVEKLDEIDADQLNVRVNDNEHFDASLLEKLKETKKPVGFFVYQDKQAVGYWLLESEDLHLINTFNKGVRRLKPIPQSFNEVLNYANAYLLEFDHDGDFEKPMRFVLDLDNQFEADLELNLYHYDENKEKFKLISQGLKVDQDEAELVLDHASIYVITPAHLKANSLFNFELPFDIYYLVLGLLVALVLSLFGNLISLIKIKKLKRHVLKRTSETKVIPEVEVEAEDKKDPN